MNQQFVIYLYNGALLSKKMEWTIDTQYNMFESQNNYTEWKFRQEVYILYNFINIKLEKAH